MEEQAVPLGNSAQYSAVPHEFFEVDGETLLLVGDEDCRLKATEAVEARDGVGFAEAFLPSGRAFDMVCLASTVLRRRGIFESALVTAFTRGPVNYSLFPVKNVLRLFMKCNRDKLREAGSVLKGPGPFIIYRGVFGRIPDRHVNGLRWTSSPERAAYDALDYNGREPHDPAIYVATVSGQEVLAFSENEHERVFVVKPRIHKRMEFSRSDIRELRNFYLQDIGELLPDDETETVQT